MKEGRLQEKGGTSSTWTLKDGKAFTGKSKAFWGSQHQGNMQSSLHINHCRKVRFLGSDRKADLRLEKGVYYSCEAHGQI